MNILFLHRSFPSQFKFPAIALSVDKRNNIYFLTQDKNTEIEGINKIVYDVPKTDSSEIHPYINYTEKSIIQGLSAANAAIKLKDQGIKPDIIIGHSWGLTLFIKEVFPDVPFICYFEWFNKYKDSVVDFDGTTPSLEEKILLKFDNSDALLDLYSCDAGFTPTEWQKNQFPKEFQDKIEVIHDGIDTERCKPNVDAKFLIKDKNIELTTQDEVITYATRSLEPMRGFPQFMEAVEKLQKIRPNAHFVIAGKDEETYSKKLKNGSYRELMLQKYNIDLSRVHFVGHLTYQEYLKLLQVSSVHFYLTFPFILSWSFLEAMSIGCNIVASNTEPVKEVMTDNYNGLLVDFFDVDKLIEKVEYALNNKDKMQQIKKNARQTIIDKYSIEVCLPKQIEFICKQIRK